MSECAFECVQEIPLADAVTISKGYCGAAAAALNKLAGANDPANIESPEAPASPATISRRLSNLSPKILRRLKCVAA
jgi:hypothetical protein